MKEPAGVHPPICYLHAAANNTAPHELLADMNEDMGSTEGKEW